MQEVGLGMLHVRFRSKADVDARPADVSFTLKADIAGRQLDVRFVSKSGHQPASDRPFIAAPNPLRGLVFRHCNHGAGKRAVRLSQLIQNREVIGVGDRYQVAWDIPLRPVGMVIAAARDHGRQLAGAVGESQRFIDDRPPHRREVSGFTTGQPDDETARTAALASCTRATEPAKHPCEIYAVGNNVVFAGGNPPMPPSPWLVRNPAIERSFASKDLPLVSDRDRAGWAMNYPTVDKPKALALGPGGYGTYYFKSEEASRRALERCGYSSGVACMIIAVDESFVVPIPTTMKAVGFFHPDSNAAIAPELRADLAQRLGNAPNAWNGVAVGGNGRPGLMLNAPDEKVAIEGALADCGRQDRNCRVIALGPFSVEPLVPSKSVEVSPLPPTNVGPAQRGSPQAPLPPIRVGPTPNLRPQ